MLRARNEDERTHPLRQISARRAIATRSKTRKVSHCVAFSFYVRALPRAVFIENSTIVVRRQGNTQVAANDLKPQTECQYFQPVSRNLRA